MTNFRDKKVAILGWGVDTQDVTPWLEKQGAKITVLDEGRGDKFGQLDKFDVLVRSPGVYRYRKEIVEAEKAGVVVTSKIKIFFDICPAKIIGVTGTKGKGTTATLIYEILKAAGKKVYLGGNIGEEIFDKLDKLDEFAWIILELSSFQLIDLEKSPHIAVVLMTTSEHQDWHKDEKEYVDAKKRLVEYQRCSDFAIVNKDYPNSVEIGKAAGGKVIWISKGDVTRLRHGYGEARGIKLRGEHNLENIAAAMAVAKIVGVPEVRAVGVVREFRGLEHRLEEVGMVNGITFYNDSFSTTPETAIAAIKAFSEPEILILGGSSKKADFTELGRVISETKNVKVVIVIGVEGPKIAKEIRGIRVIGGGAEMEKIVEMAYNNATKGDIVLLSPACASFDMFKNYKDRGEQFKKAVGELEKSGSSGGSGK